MQGGPRPVETARMYLGTNGRVVGNLFLPEDNHDNYREAMRQNGGVDGNGGSSIGSGGMTRKERVAYRSRQQRSVEQRDGSGSNHSQQHGSISSTSVTSLSSSTSTSSTSSPVKLHHPAYLNTLNGVPSPSYTNAKLLDQLATTRQKKLRFDRSLIHAWGMFADQDIAANDFVIEYKGELVSAKECERRSKMYEEEGRDDYIFRVDKQYYIDATMRGSMARFINHCCDPNCYTQIIKHKKESKIIIYAKRDIKRGEELSYDYKFPYEEKKIGSRIFSAKFEHNYS